MKAVFFETSKPQKKTLARALKGLKPAFYKERLTPENVLKAKEAEIISIFVNSEITKKIIKALPKLKLIATRSTGFDHIDIKYAKSKGIAIVNVPAYGSRTVAEFTFGLILNLSRKIFGAYHQLRETASFDISEFQGFDLQNKTLGVVGTGRIGKNVIKIARAFDMKVLAYDIYPDRAFAVELDFHYADLPEVLAQSDIVTLHVPYTKKTHHLINKNNIKLFKKGAYLINTARGEVLDTKALIYGLKEGYLAGAGLDVLEGERQLKEELELLTKTNQKSQDFKTLLSDHVLIDLPQVIVTPHIAFFTQEAVEEILKTTAQNIKAFISGAPQNLV
jgi:D-lactate dehydrogenase